MDARIAYWTAAWLNMAVIVSLAAAGIARAKHRSYASHKRLMLASAALVGLFVLSYVVKVYELGREPLETWDHSFVLVLWVHELCIAVMLAAGLTAGVQAHRLGPAFETAGAAGLPNPALQRGVRLHRRAGNAAFWAALCGVCTAAYVLYGMYQR